MPLLPCLYFFQLQTLQAAPAPALAPASLRHHSSTVSPLPPHPWQGADNHPAGHTWAVNPCDHPMKSCRTITFPGGHLISPKRQGPALKSCRLAAFCPLWQQPTTLEKNNLGLFVLDLLCSSTLGSLCRRSAGSGMLLSLLQKQRGWLRRSRGLGPLLLFSSGCIV